MKFISKLFKIAALSLIAVISFSSCASMKARKECSRTIAARGIKSAEELTAFFMSQNPNADRTKIQRLAKYYILESRMEGINSDIAWIQMCHETGFLCFGNLVTEDMNNFCGLGAINEENRGLRFESELIGVRAHIQHLHAYGTTEDKVLKNELVDPRYRFVNPRGKSPTIFGLSGTWAADKEYGLKLDSLLARMEY